MGSEVGRDGAVSEMLQWLQLSSAEPSSEILLF